MFHPIYLIWFLLPLGLLLLALWAFLKPYLGVFGKEDAWDYLKQGLFCLFAFLVAVGIDSRFINNYLEDLAEEPTDVLYVIHWVFYPVVLLALAYLFKIFKRVFMGDKKDDLSLGLSRYKR